LSSFVKRRRLSADARMDLRRTCQLRVLVTHFLQSGKLGCRQLR
jgi:hypothetical protein